MTRYLIAAAVMFSTVSCAQSFQNRRERARDRQDLRQDGRQLADDRFDAARAMQLLKDYDAAAAMNDVTRLGQLDVSFNQHLSREIAESKVESAQARQELREDKRELALDRDKRRDRVNLADDRTDATREALSRAHLIDVQNQLTPLAGRFDPGAISQKRSLYAQVLNASFTELSRDKREGAEDRRELREDRRR